MWHRQKGLCALCERAIPLVIDHEHLKGWRKLPAKERRKAVRMLACRWCNGRYLRHGMDARKAANMARYLKAYERRNVQSAK